jgi:membrane-bound metal-dependent hydrolase YbcI (DUF457 family)
VWVVGHGQVGWLMAWGARLSPRDRKLVTVAAMAPDLDGLAILGGHQAYFDGHHVWLHSVFAAAGFGLLAAALAQRRVLTGLLAVLAVLLHLLSDGFGLLQVYPLWPASRWIFWPGDGRFGVAAIGEVVVPVLLLTAQVVIARRTGESILELLPRRAQDWLRRRWRERFR